MGRGWKRARSAPRQSLTRQQDYHQLKEELGLDHYEGRNWQGWHHHVTMVMVAHAFLTLETLRAKKNVFVYRAGAQPREVLARRRRKGVSIRLTSSMEKASGS